MSLNFNFIYVKVSEVAELQSEEPNPHAIFFIWLNASWLIAPKFDLIADDNDVNFNLKIIFKYFFYFFFQRINMFTWSFDHELTLPNWLIVFNEEILRVFNSSVLNAGNIVLK